MSFNLEKVFALIDDSLALLPEEKVRLKELFPSLSEEDKKQTLLVLNQELLERAKIVNSANKEFLDSVQLIQFDSYHDRYLSILRAHEAQEKEEKDSVDDILNELDA